MNALRTNPLKIILADDDADDHFFFSKALEEITVRTQLTIAEDGEQLMDYLLKNLKNLPDVLFIDFNMPRKNGAQCLAEIKQHSKLRSIPVIMYSTSCFEQIADVLYENGAQYFFRKTTFPELKKNIDEVLSLIIHDPRQPEREEFIIGF